MTYYLFGSLETSSALFDLSRKISRIFCSGIEYGSLSECTPLRFDLF